MDRTHYGSNAMNPPSKNRERELSDIELRRVSPDDLDAIVSVHIRSWQHTYRGLLPEEFLQGLDPDPRRQYWSERIKLDATPRHRVVVAAANKTTIGFVYTCPNTSADAPDAPREARSTESPVGNTAPVGLLEYIHVDPDWLGKGIGKSLMHAAMQEMRQEGFDSSVLWVIRENSRARRFYESVGWRTDGLTRMEHLAVGREAGLEVPTIRYSVDLRDVASHAEEGQPRATNLTSLPHLGGQDQ